MSLDVWLTVNVDTGGKQPETIELFSANITHNLNEMATEAGIYEELWRPEEIGAILAGDIVDAIEVGLQKMKDDPEHYKTFDSSNGWGLYENFVPWIEKYLEACKNHPKATIGISR